MQNKRIRKFHNKRSVAPNLVDYQGECANFSWDSIRSELDGLPGNAGLNIAHEAIDRHANGKRSKHVALRHLDNKGRAEDFTYAQMRDLSNRFANVLQQLGVGKGDRVFSLLGRIPELYITAFGTLKNGSVFSPLFSAYGPQPIKERLIIGTAKVLVTTELFFYRKIVPILETLPELMHVLIITDADNKVDIAPALDFHQCLQDAEDIFTIVATSPEDQALLHFTSGTTGKPKGAMHVHAAVVMHYMSARFALDIHPHDICWCTADPGWVTGTSYGIIAPLTMGATLVVDEGEFDVERWYQILQDTNVTVWYTAPTAIRMLMKYGLDMVRKYRIDHLRFIASVGEPLNPEAVHWGVEAFGLPIHDNWWQTETGAIMIANYVGMDIKPGSMGRPLPGIDTAVVKRKKNGGVELIEGTNQLGELALKSGWPSMFRGYLGDDERYQKCFAGDWYLTGDLVRRDEDGYFWFVARTDDVIKSSGHLIGPFEVESVLMEHPAVAEVGVIGKPDPLTLETVKAYIVLKPKFTAAEKLRLELLAYARKRLGATVAPKEIEFQADLPKTQSGKIMRRLLKSQEYAKLGKSDSE